MNKFDNIQHMTKQVVDYVQVWSINLGAIYVGTMDVEQSVKILAGLVAIGYTSWKWYHEYKDRKSKKG